MIEVSVLGRKVMFKRFPQRIALNCVKVCHVKGFTFSLVSPVEPRSDVVIHTDFYVQLHKRFRCPKKLPGERIIGTIGATALARLGVVDRRIAEDAARREEWEKYFQHYRSQFPDATDAEARAYANHLMAIPTNHE